MADCSSTLKLILDNIEIRADAIATVCEGVSIDFKTLGRHSAFVKTLLQEQDVDEQTVIGIMLARSNKLVPAILGTWAIGAAFYPLDPKFPSERLAQFSEQAKPKLILTDNASKDAAQDLCKNVVVINDAQMRLHQETLHAVELDSSSLAYILFTSGSTGEPKGVRISHGSLANFMTAMSERLELPMTTVSLAHSTICFDVMLLEMLMPLCVGGRALIATAQQSSSQSHMIELLDHATLVHATPSLLQILVAAGWEPRKAITILSGAEAIRLPLVKQLSSAGAIWNLYGPTETTIYASCYPIKADDVVIPVGQPLNNMAFHVLDDTLQPCQMGELYISGTGLSLGYSSGDNTPFVMHPTLKKRMYRTGDKVQILPNGQIEWMGRSSSEIKVRGNRVAPREIEKALESMPAIEYCVVKMHRFENQGNEALTAYILAKGEIDKQDVDATLLAMLPSYMVPEFYVVMNELPMTTNGKVDKDRLQCPSRKNILRSKGKSREMSESSYDETTVNEICAVFSKLLNIDSFESDDRFADMGVNSVNIVVASSLLTKRLNKKVPIEIFYSSETPKSVAAKLLEVA